MFTYNEPIKIHMYLQVPSFSPLNMYEIISMKLKFLHFFEMYLQVSHSCKLEACNFIR